MSILLKLAALIAIGLVYDPGPFDPDVIRKFDGKPVGLCDAKHKEILPAKYSRIEYAGNGLFMTTSLNPTQHFEFGEEKRLFTRDGVEVPLLVPEGCKFVRLLWPGANAANNPAVDLQSLPVDTLLRFERDGFNGICDSFGQIIIPARYMLILAPLNGKALLAGDIDYFRGPKNLTLFDCKLQTLKKIAATKNVYSLSPAKSPYQEMVEVQDMKAPGHRLWYQPIARERVVKITNKPDDGKFDSSVWQQCLDYKDSRFNSFSRFLNDYNLIGMRRADLIALIGTGSKYDESDDIFYPFYITCSHPAPGVVISLKDDKVHSWCYQYFGTRDRNITTNVLLVRDEYDGANPVKFHTVEKVVKAPER